MLRKPKLITKKKFFLSIFCLLCFIKAVPQAYGEEFEYNSFSHYMIDFSEVNAEVEEPQQIEQAKTEVTEETPQPCIAYTQEEVAMLECVVQNEVNSSGIEHKRIIADIIVNRVLSENFPNSITDVLHASNQFPTISNYYNVKFPVDDDTRQAVQDILTGACQGVSQGALYFYNPHLTSKATRDWFENSLIFLFEIEEELGTHRFFK